MHIIAGVSDPYTPDTCSNRQSSMSPTCWYPYCRNVMVSVAVTACRAHEALSSDMQFQVIGTL